MYREDKKLLEEFRQIRNIQPSTMKNYKSTVNIYTKLQHKSLTSLIREAEREEEQNISWRNRKLKTRLIQFRTYLIDNDYLEKSIREYMQRIKTIYYTYEIEIKPLPNTSNKNVRKSPPVNFSDLPDKELLQKILQLCTSSFKF